MSMAKEVVSEGVGLCYWRHVPGSRVSDALFPRFAVQTMPGVGHWMHAQAPDETIRVVREFLDRDEAE